MNLQQEVSLDITYLQKLTQQIEKEREFVKKIFFSTNQSKPPIQITTALMIVESPTKAKTIASFFGKPAKRLLKNMVIYETILGEKILLIGASMGHIVDLPTKPYLRGIKIQKNKFIPIYETIKTCKTYKETINYTDTPPSQKCLYILDKKQIIYDFQNIGEEVDEIYLASDPDTEGEKIAFDFYNLLRPFNGNIYRIEYHQVTKNAILEAISTKRQIDINWVRAQIVRRIADRFVGFSLSKKLQQMFKSSNYSAGRVQTPVLGWIITREKEVAKKILEIKLNIQNQAITLKEESLSLESKLKDISYVLLELISTNQKEIPPFSPFATDSLLSTASDKLKWTPEYVMSIAQSLFEKGLITYHRTDSHHISSTGINIAKTYLQTNKMEDFFYPRSWGPQSTHEGIRPTKPLDSQTIQEWSNINNIDISPNEIQLYEMIFNRFIASQTKNTLIAEGEFKVQLLGKNKNLVKSYNLVLPIKILKPYWTIFWPYQIYAINPGKYPFNGEIKKIPKKFYYSFSELIQQMKQKGLGRPSTYAIIIDTLIKRKYVIKIFQKYLKATSKGKNVYNYLTKLYHHLIGEEFTAFLEAQMDKVEQGADHHSIIGQLLKKLIDLKLISYRYER